jgi:uncharacterized protein (TIGR02996 family)
MTDTGRAFLRAICDNSELDGPRLTMADWLEGEGQGERAELVRVQCWLAMIPETHQCCDCLVRGNRLERVCDWCTLRGRERELLGRHGGDWLALPFTDWTTARWPQSNSVAIRWTVDGGEVLGLFRRGFVAAVTLAWPAAVAHLDAILDAAPVTDVTIRDWPMWQIPESVHAGHFISASSDLLRLEGRRRWHRIPYEHSPSPGLRGRILQKLLAAEWPRVTTWNLPADGHRGGPDATTPAAVAG